MKPLAYYLSLVLVFTSSWENIVFVEGIGRLSRLVGIVLAGVWCLSVIASGEIRKPRPFHICTALFVLWCCTSILWTVDVEMTYERIKTLVQLLVLVAVLWDLYRTPDQVAMAMQAYVLGCFVSIGSVVQNYLFSVEVMHERFAATGFNPNDFGLIVALGMPMAWYLAMLRDQENRSRILRAINALYVPAAVIGIVFAASRGSLLAASPIVPLIALSLSRLSIWPRVVIAGAFAGFVACLPFVVPADSIDRLSTIGESIASWNVNGRIAIWKEGIRILAEHQFLGVGSGAFRSAASETRTVAHNVFLSILVELGIVGLGSFLTLLALVVWDAIRQPKWIAIAWITVLMIWFIGALVHTWEQRKQTWLVFSFVTVSATALSRLRDEPYYPSFQPIPQGQPQ